MWSNETSFVSVVSMIMIKEISEISYIYIYFFEISRRYFARFSRRELATHCATKRGAERDPSSSWRKLWQIFQVGSTRARTNERPVISKHSIRALEERISPQQLFPSRKNLWGGISRIEGDRFKLVLDPIGWLANPLSNALSPFFDSPCHLDNNANYKTRAGSNFYRISENNFVNFA